MPQSFEPRHQTRLSSYFTPSLSPRTRTSHIVDLTVDSSDEERTPKRQRRSSASLELSPRLSKPSSSKTHNKADQWRYSRAESTLTEGEPQAPSFEKSPNLSKRETLKKKLLLERESSFFIRGRSSANLQVSSPDLTKNIGEDTHSDSSEPEFWETTGASTNKTSKGKQKAAPVKSRAKRGEDLGPSGEPWTPLEKQVAKLKHDNPGTLLMIEVGYKYKFFDEDAKIAANVLGMVAFRDRNFLVASIPVERRDVHLKNLLSHGHRVGIVNQVETAALKKAGDNRNAPFERKLVRLYTAATYVDALDSVDMMETQSPPPFLCIVEDRKAGKGSNVTIALISVCPSTGDVVYDEFEDSLMRLELETRLAHLKPAELLCPNDGLTRPTTKLLTELTSPSSAGGPGVRLERFPKLMTYSEAFSFLSAFYTERRNSNIASENLRTGKLIASFTAFSSGLVIALAHIIKHLSTYNVADVLLETKFFTPFGNRSHMILAANTLRNLEIFENETDHSVQGSLLWVLDQTKSKFGARLMKYWVGHPLTDQVALQERVDAVEEIITSSSDKLVTLRQILRKLPDLARGLCRIRYGQCTPQELAILLPAFKKIAFAFEPLQDSSKVGFKSPLLNNIVFALPFLQSSMTELFQTICLKHAADGRKDELWLVKDKYPKIEETRMGLLAVEVELQEMLKTIRKVLKRPSLEFETVAGEEYLVEVEKSARIDIPVSWRLISATKSKARYRPSDVQLKLEERFRWQETLDIESGRSYSSFLDEISQKYYSVMRNAVNKLAEADCLMSLAQVGLQPSGSYTRPVFVDNDELEIVEGRHPMIELLRSDPFIPNTVRMGSSREPRSKIVTGPNMGGKSSSVRMVALIAIMAQIGSYVPATSVRLGMLDSVLTRMGAWDDLARGRSTFMVEMSETSEILQSATKNSLVILDELGRGTSTFDGMAIASAVLQHLVNETKCKTLFITHYPLVAAEIERRFPDEIQNLHMGYTAESRIDGTRDITFLYRLTKGIASDSFGVECGRLAGLPEDILRAASEKSAMMQEIVQMRIARNRVRNTAKLISQLKHDRPSPELLFRMIKLVDSTH
ncbi:DNA mismatch repair protein MSH3 [Lentinula detonsa]|uniref:DNA mismatch repair protein MSH3 n=2 Tax=Lentinula detonsa TaxID=2804962 RepID=A0AA38Q3V8_9AGAR|nr:DNA mismatch repair protein MSH3 [Lentinula detonsa]